MAQGIFKNGERIELTYQAAGGVTALTPTAIVFDEAAASHAAETSQLISSLLIGELEDGAYSGGFTPDAEGKWTAVIDDGTGSGTVSQTFRVCGHNLDDVGDAASAALIKATSALGKASSADSQATIAAGYAASGATSAAVAAIASPASVS